MTTRRQALGAIALPLGASALGARLDPARIARALGAFAALEDAPSERAAQDEALWLEAQQAFVLDRSLVNLNVAGVSPSPSAVLDALQRHWTYSNPLPTVHMWQVLEPQKESVRAGLARLLRCEAEEIALTRNASEGLETCQLGIDLEPGAEILTTDQDYPRMLHTFRQRARREKLALKLVRVPVPCEDPSEIVRRYAEAITPRTRLILVCHVINLTGQILPVRGVVDLARSKGIPAIVDGAHSFGHFPFEIADLGCDYFATSLHKWLFAPHGTGLLFVRRERIPALWPLMGAPEGLQADIRKFEEIGTHPAAPFVAIAEALAFHLGLGPARKAARLRHLRDLWATRLARHDRVRLHTSLKPEFSCGIATFQVEGIDSAALQDHLWKRHRILTALIDHPDCRGVRVSPSVHTTAEELERFCEVVETAIREGLPS